VLWLWGYDEKLGRNKGGGEVVLVKSGWRWSEVEAKTEVKWQPCYEKYDCAKLDVPLDWLDPSEKRRAAIAILRFNATDRKDYKGPVFINPGMYF